MDGDMMRAPLSPQALSVIWQMFGPQSTQAISVPIGQLDEARAIRDEIRAWVQAQATPPATPPAE